MTMLREVARQVLLRGSRAIGEASVVLVIELVRTSHCILRLISNTLSQQPQDILQDTGPWCKWCSFLWAEGPQG